MIFLAGFPQPPAQPVIHLAKQEAVPLEQYYWKIAMQQVRAEQQEQLQGCLALDLELVLQGSLLDLEEESRLAHWLWPEPEREPEHELGQVQVQQPGQVQG